MNPIVPVRGANGYDVEAASEAAMLVFPDGEVSRTQQQFKDDTNINVILAKWVRTGAMPQAARLPQYGDFVGPDSYMDALSIVHEADKHFDSLSGKVRARFANDPSKFLEFMSDECNREEAIELGLVSKPPAAPAVSPDVPIVVPPVVATK